MQLINKYNKGFQFVLCATDNFSKYALIIILKDRKKTFIITEVYQKVLNESKRKLNKIWVNKGSEIVVVYYNRSVKSWLQDNDMEMYSTNNEGKSVFAERFIGTLKNQIYKYMASISKNVYIDKLDDILNEYNNTNHRTIKMEPIDVKLSMYIDFGAENNDEGP